MNDLFQDYTQQISRGEINGEVGREVPLDRMVIETDVPFFIRGTFPRTLVGRKIAQMRIICTVQEVVESTTCDEKILQVLKN